MEKFFSRPAPAIVIIVAVMVLGLFKFFDLPIALYPDTSRPKLYAWLNTGSTNAEEFRERFGKQLEAALQSTQDVVRVEGRYSNGGIDYTVTYDWGTGSDEARSRARSALATVEAQFPKEWGNFNMWFDGSEGGQALVSIFSEKFTPEELAEIAEQSIKPKLSRINGMGDVFISRFDQKYVSIAIDSDALLQQKISLSEVRLALESYELDKGLGQLDLKEGGYYQVTARLKKQDIESLRNAVIGSAGERAIKLRDVAAVTLAEDLPTRFFKGNGQRSLIVGGQPKPDANIKTVSDEFFSVLQKEASAIDPDMQIKTLLNPAGFITEAVRNVLIAVVAGMLIASFVVFLFLGSLRNTLIVSISIPVSLVGGFILMYLLGIELNLISLGAMALACGMVVDGSIVVLENIYRVLDDHLALNPGKTSLTISERVQLVARAVAEVRSPVIASLLTTIVVFAPLPFTSPLASAILGDLAVVMVCVLVFSVFVTLFLIPPLAVALRLSGGGSEKKRGLLYLIPNGFNFIFRKVERFFSRIVWLLLSRRWLAAALSALLLVLAVGAGWVLTTKVEREIMARPHTDKVFLFLRVKDEKIDIKQTETIVNGYETQILEKWGSDISHTLSQINKGRPWVLVFLKNKDDIVRIKKELEEHFQNTPLVNVNVFDWNPTSLEIPNPPMLRMFVSGKTEVEKRELIDLISEKVQTNKDVGRISSAPKTRKSDFINIDFDPELASRISEELGQSLTQSVLPVVGGFLGERTIGNLQIDGTTMNMKMKVSGDLIKRPGDIENILIGLKGSIVPLKAVAKVTHVSDYADISVDNGHLASVVEVWPKESYTGKKDVLEKDLRAALAADSSIENSRLVFDDTGIEINENIASLTDALVLSILLILIVVCVQFGSLLQTSIIMLAVPLGFIGVSFSLWLFSSKLSVNSMLGLILLAGTAVNNSILLMDFFNRLRAEQPHAPLVDVLLSAVRLRLRPIMITTLTTILGMLPIAIGFGSGSEILQPLGIAVCGGLLISTVLTVLLVPVAIKIVESLKARFSVREIKAEMLPAGDA